jgi:2-keto-4-pentenoate hydratase/2-oxohepta-3-ene-1,7-dioic acid hydratase in catechol pathway
MRLATFRRPGETTTRLGRIDGNDVLDLSVAAPDLPHTMLALLQGGPALLKSVEGAVATPAHRLALSAITLEAPIANPQKFLAIGMNYKAHAEEARRAGMTVPTSQLWFNKQVSCINGPYAPVHLPQVSKALDYEVELGVVIGRRAYRVPAEEALGYIAGFVICNDVSVRDWQMRSPTFTLGKSFPTHGPIGPWITTPDEIGDAQALDLRLFVNGELRQSANTSDMVYGIAEQIAYLSTAMILEPGDVLATGTPSGVGVAHTPPRFLQVGDVVRAEIPGLGHLENPIVAEP